MPRWSRLDRTADRRLVKGLHGGDRDALTTLYDAYAERLYDYAVVMLGDEKSASDVVHDAFIDAFRRAARVRERTRLRPWLYAAVRRRCLARRTSDLPVESLAECDPTQRETLFLAHRHDVTGDDLAAVLGLPARRARRKLNRAAQRAPDAAGVLDDLTVPILPASLRHRVVHTGTDPELSGYRAQIAARGGTLTPAGLPRQPDAPSHLARRWVFAGAGSAAGLATAVVALLIIGSSLPGPKIQWPYGKPNPHEPGSPARPRQDGNPSSSPPEAPVRPTGQPPGAAPQLVESKPPPAKAVPSPPPASAIAVSPHHVHFRKRTRVANMRLTALAGPITWSASESSPQISLSSAQGVLRKNDHTIVQVFLDRGLVTLPGQATITIVDGRGRPTLVTVDWTLSLL